VALRGVAAGLRALVETDVGAVGKMLSAPAGEVGRCRLSVSKPVLKAHVVSVEAII
jgi:hypothetical protein